MCESKVCLFAAQKHFEDLSEEVDVGDALASLAVSTLMSTYHALVHALWQDRTS